MLKLSHRKDTLACLGLLVGFLSGPSAAAVLQDLCAELEQSMAMQAAQMAWTVQMQCAPQAAGLARQLEASKECVWQEMPPTQWKAGPMGVALRCALPVAKRYQVPVTLTLTSRLWVTARPVSPGALLQEADLLRQDSPWPSGTRASQFPTERPMGYRVLRTLQRGDVVTTDALASPLSLPQGSVVDLVLSTGAVQLQAKGRLTATASIGDRVKVQLMHRRDLLDGVLADDKTVLIDNKDSR